MILRKNEIKHYSGLESELISTLPSGDTFFCTDTNKLYKYNEDKLPYLISGLDGAVGPEGPAGAGLGNTGAPFELLAAIGGSSIYSDSNNTVYLSWSGGSGQYDLTLPSAAIEPYRVIRFISDGTIGANDKVHLVAPGVETIDGVSDYILNKPYSGVQAWSDGTNWIIMQAKS